MTELMPAEGVFSLIWLLIALPLAGAACCCSAVAGRTPGAPTSACSPSAPPPSSVSLMLLGMMQNSPEQRTFDQTLFSWVFVGDFSADMAFQLDQLSIVFVLLITIVGTLIHVYSLGYMAHDENRRKFFGYLNLFVAAMLLLVLANNYLLLYVGWEGVGLASYLLIGFWQHKPSAAAAAQEGVRHQPRRRRRTQPGDHAAVRDLRVRLLPGGLRGGRPGQRGHPHRHRPAPPAGGLRQVGAVPAAGVAARRHGGPDPGLGPDPRGDDGHRRRLPDRPQQRDLRRRPSGRPSPSSSSA